VGGVRAPVRDSRARRRVRGCGLRAHHTIGAQDLKTRKKEKGKKEKKRKKRKKKKEKRKRKERKKKKKGELEKEKNEEWETSDESVRCRVSGRGTSSGLLSETGT
jgi:hypothetical protein